MENPFSSWNLSFDAIFSELEANNIRDDVGGAYGVVFTEAILSDRRLEGTSGA